MGGSSSLVRLVSAKTKMSLDINWSLLSDADPSTHAGLSTEPIASSLAAHLISTLNAQLSSTASGSRPSFLGPIQIEAFDFGQKGPDVEIRDVRDVWRAFDEDEDADEDEDGHGGGMHRDGHGGYGEGSYEEGYWYENEYGEEVWYPGHPPDEMYQEDMEEIGDEVEAESVFSGMSPRKMGIGDVGMSFGLRRPDLPMSLGQASTASQRRGTMDSRHLPRTHLHHSSRPPVHRRSSHATHLTHTQSYTHPPSPMARPNGLPGNPHADSDPESSSSVPSLQLHLHISYTSDASIILLTSLQVNYPSSAFMALPLKLVITGLRLEADLVLAYAPGAKGGHKVHICIVDEGADEPTQDDYGYGAGYGYAGQDQGSSIGQRILPELHIESEIGHADAHVLRNVGKVERFIAEAVRKVLVNELVFPNFHTIAL